ncbi:MAG: hypothetical protein WCF81_10945 [Roseiarcus sp.]
MDKTIMGLLGGASALALLGGSQASAAPPVDEVNVLQPALSFAELLDPIPNAEKVLRAEDERTGTVASEEKPMVMAQYYHHHHHHHYHHHHHHYHHHHYYHHYY